MPEAAGDGLVPLERGVLIPRGDGKRRVAKRAIGSRTVAPSSAAHVAPVPRRSWKWSADTPAARRAACQRGGNFDRRNGNPGRAGHRAGAHRGW